MNMIEKKYVYALILFLIIDYFYINSGLVPYFDTIKEIQGKELKPKLGGLLAYIVMSYTVVSIAKTPIDAAKIAFSIYSIFNLTNYFMFENWTLFVSVADTIWGAMLFYIVKRLIE